MYNMCPHTPVYVSSYSYIFVLRLAGGEASEASSGSGAGGGALAVRALMPYVTRAAGLEALSH